MKKYRGWSTILSKGESTSQLACLTSLSPLPFKSYPRGMFAFPSQRFPRGSPQVKFSFEISRGPSWSPLRTPSEIPLKPCEYRLNVPLDFFANDVMILLVKP